MSTEPAAATRAPVVLYDTTLRDGTQGENITLSLADKIRIARMLDEYGMPYIEGGWPGSNPKDIEFFAAARTMTWSHAKLAAFGSTRHKANRGRRRTPTSTSWWRPRRRWSPSSASPGTSTSSRSWAATLDQNVDMIAESVAFVARARPRGHLRRRALLRRLQGRPRLRAAHAARGAGGRCPRPRPLRHQRRHAHRRAGAHLRGHPRRPGGRPRRACR